MKYILLFALLSLVLVNSLNIKLKDKRPYNQCLLCEQVISNLEFNAKETTDSIVAKLLERCSHLSLYSEQCTNFVNNNALDLITYVQTHDSPAGACAHINLCPPIKTKFLPSDNDCQTCEAFVDKSEFHIKNNVTNLETALLADCQKLPLYQEHCITFVKQYANAIFNSISTHSPAQVCTDIHLCPALVSTKPVSRYSEDDCHTCMHFVHKAENCINHDLTNVEQLLLQDCSRIPVYSDLCNSFVTQYGNEINTLVQKNGPSEVCSDLQLCPSIQSLFANEDDCQTCEAFVWKHEMNVNSKVDNVEAKLLQECSELPLYSEKCSSFVQQYANEMIQTVHQFGPRAACSKLKLCPAKN